MRLKTAYRGWLDLALFFAAILVGTLAWIVISDLMGWEAREPESAKEFGTSRSWYAMIEPYIGGVSGLLVLRFFVYPLLGWEKWLLPRRRGGGPDAA
jgi:hypothetical protein